MAVFLRLPNPYMTQPAVSQAIMQLESELEIRLFTRTPKGSSN